MLYGGDDSETAVCHYLTLCMHVPWGLNYWSLNSEASCLPILTRSVHRHVQLSKVQAYFSSSCLRVMPNPSLVSWLETSDICSRLPSDPFEQQLRPAWQLIKTAAATTGITTEA